MRSPTLGVPMTKQFWPWTGAQLVAILFLGAKIVGSKFGTVLDGRFSLRDLMIFRLVLFLGPQMAKFLSLDLLILWGKNFYFARKFFEIFFRAKKIRLFLKISFFRLCDKTGWSHSMEKPLTGSILQLSWSPDATQIAAGCANGHVIFAHIVERRVEWRQFEALQTKRKSIEVGIKKFSVLNFILIQNFQVFGANFFLRKKIQIFYV